MRRNRLPGFGVLIAALLPLAASAESPGNDPAARCTQGISAETAEHLFKVLHESPPGARCAFRSVQTAKSVLDVTWSTAGRTLPPLRITPAGCAPASPIQLRRGDFDLAIPGALTAACPEVAALIDRLSGTLSEETPVRETNAPPLLTDPLLLSTEAAFGLALLLVAFVLARALRRRRPELRWVFLGGLGFAAALLVRSSVPFSLGNWYEEVLPATGSPPWMRFGPGAYAFELLLRGLSLWSPRTLAASQLILGALAVPLLVGILRELRVGWVAALASAILLTLAPFHVRLSATGSAHVLASACALGMLWAWLAAVRSADLPAFALAVLLFSLAALTRVDMILQVSLFALWPLLRDGSERVPGAALAARGRWLSSFAVLTLAVIGVAYTQVVIPSHHPGPDYAVAGRIARDQLVQQFWILARQPPRWFSLSAVLLAIVGLPWMAWRRPALLARVGATVALSFLGLCRTFLHDELVGARYFLALIPIFLILSGFGFEALLAGVPRRARAPAVALAGIALALWTGLAARGAYAARYAFQDEYTFAREALRKLPPGCVVYELSLRPEQIPHDLDCCLDLPRSPLPLDLPQLRFEPLPDETASVFEQGSCHAYYESIACDFKPEENAAERDSAAVDLFRQECAAVRRVGHFRPLAEATTSPRSTFPFFAGGRPHAGLYQWTR